MTAHHGPTLRSIVPSVYLPSILFGVGHGAILPVIPLTARDLGASVAIAGLVVAGLGIGRMVGDLPAGMIAIRMGERRAMLAALGAVIAALAVCIAATSVLALAAAIVVMGFASAVFGLARHAYLADVMPYRLRGRALSSLGGTHRIGIFVGPFLGAASMIWLGLDGAYWLHIVVAAAAATALLVAPDPPSVARTKKGDAPAHREGVFRVMRRQASVLRTLGFAALLVGAARAAREVSIPLWGEHIGLSPEMTSIVFGLSGALEMVMFYPAGMAMDRFGRRWVAVPSMMILGTGMIVVPLTSTMGTFAIVAMVMGFGNGLGSGLIMTIGADAAPDGNRAAFLAAFRLLSDIGNATGPVLVSAVTAATTLALAITAAGGLAYGSAVSLAKWVPRRTS